MSSATPMTSSVRDVLLNTSAPTGSSDSTAVLASTPEPTTRQRIPLPSSAVSAARIRSSEASVPNSATASSLGALEEEGSPTSFAAELRETVVDQPHGHGSPAG